jgi:hypothetical protein
MRTSNKTIMVVLGVGAVLGLAGQALAQGSFSRGRDDSRGFSRGRDGSRGGSYGRDSFRGGFDGRAPYVNRGFTGGFSVGYVESPRYYAAPRVVAPWSLGYYSPAYVAPQCGMTRSVFVAPQCGVRRPVFVPPFFPQHRYEQPTWRYCR